MLNRTLQALALSSIAGAQSVHLDLQGTQAEQEFGEAVAVVGDLDGDGHADVVIGASGTNFQDGAAFVHSGKTGAVLLTIAPGAGGYGRSVCGPGDVDGDGVPDVGVGASWGPAGVYSGADGSLIYQSPPTNSRTEIANAGDVNSDGHPDILFGRPSSSAGVVIVISGLDGSTIHTIQASAAEEWFGESLASIGDIDLDGHADFIVGAYSADFAGQDSGRATVFSGLDATPIHVIDGSLPAEALGTQVAGLGDLDGDGIPEFGVGAPGHAAWTGRVNIYSGASGALLMAFDGEAAGDRLARVAGLGDFDGDGGPDVILGAGGDWSSGHGWAKVVSGTTGALIMRLDGELPGDQLGLAVSSAGDLDGDGLDDVLIGSPGALLAGPDTGRVAGVGIQDVGVPSIGPDRRPSAVWMVDDAGGGDFLTLQAAIYAASDGDTILIQSAPDEFAVVNSKSLSILKLPGGTAYLYLKVEGLLDGKEVHVSELHGGISLSNCQGRVRLDGCKGKDWSVQDCEDVVFRRCAVDGDDGYDGCYSFGGDGEEALYVFNSNVVLYDCDLVGGNGGWDTCGGGYPPGYGGPGLDINGNSTVHISDSRVVSGFPDLEDISGPFVDITAPASRIDAPDTVSAGEEMPISVMGKPGHEARLLVSPWGSRRVYQPNSGVRHVDNTGVTLILGTIPQSGVLETTLAPAALPIGNESRRDWIQVLMTKPNGKVYYGPVTARITTR